MPEIVPPIVPPIVMDQIQGADAEKQFSALEDQAFSVPPNGHYLDDFPIWDPASHPAPGTVFRLGAFEGPKLVAAAGVRLAEIQFPKAVGVSARTANLTVALTVAMIGAVATSVEYRGRGLASQLVSMAVQWAEKRGATLAMLWGSEHELYAKLGFAPCGTQASIPLSSLQGSSSNSDVKISTGWVPGILSALKSRRSGVVIRDEDRAWLSAHRNVQWFWTGSPKQVSAYAALGRGIDLSHFVHEWGGEMRELLPILRHIHGLDREAKLLGSPAIFARQGLQHDPATEERLGLVQVIDAVAVFRAVHRTGSGGGLADCPFGASWIQGKSGAGSWKLSLAGSNGKTASDSLGPLELSKLFFGPVPPGLGRPWSEFFPLPLWFWGLDAV